MPSAAPRTTLHPALGEGLRHQIRGELRPAARCFFRARREQRRDPEALLLLGILARQTGRHLFATNILLRAAWLAPHSLPIRVNLGLAWLAAGEPAQAERTLRHALRLQPGSPQALCALAEVARASGRPADCAALYAQAAQAPEAAQVFLQAGRQLAAEHNIAGALATLRAGCFHFPDHIALLRANAALELRSGDPAAALVLCRRLVALQPHEANHHLLLGNAWTRAANLLDAVLSFRRAVALAPDQPGPLLSLADALLRLGDCAEAARCFRRAVELAPEDATAHHGLGTALAQAGRHGEAEQAFRTALASLPSGHVDASAVLNSLGATLLHLRARGEAEACFQRALALDPASAAAHVNLANLARHHDSPEEVERLYRRGVELAPECAGARYNLALTDLRAGRFTEGWAGYRHRWEFRELGMTRRHTHLPAWQGEPLAGRTLLLHAEQGLGDTLQFVRYVPLLAARGARVLLEVQPPLLTLLAGLPGTEQVFARGTTSRLRPELQCPLMDLPGLFGTTLDSIPIANPYLRVPEEQVEAARSHVPSDGRLRVGLVWAGNPRFSGDAERSMPFAALAPLLDTPGVHFVSLQKGKAAEQLRPHPSLTDAAPQLQDFRDTAALISTLDLVLSVDTAVAHLAGALDRPASVLLPRVACWRWLLDRDDSPWYPSLRLFRQHAAGDWEEVVARVRTALTTLAATPPVPRPRPVPLAPWSPSRTS